MSNDSGKAQINEPCRIICEGASDRSFFNSLIRIRGIANCEADCARLDTKPEQCAGKYGITDTLRGLRGYAEAQPGKIQGVIVAIDTDTDPKKRLQETIDYIQAAGLKPPAKYLEIKKAKKRDEFAIAIVGIPSPDRAGNLDLLLFEAMQRSHADLMAPLETYCEHTKARNEDWPIGPKSKMKLRCTIAASYRDDPGLSLSYILMRENCPVDLKDAAFDQVAQFLREFVSGVTS